MSSEPIAKAISISEDPHHVQESPSTLLGFFDSLDVNRAFKKSSWNVEKHVKRLVQIIEDEDSDSRTVLAAMEVLRRHAMESLRMGGHIRDLTLRLEAHNADNTHSITADEQSLKLLQGSTSRTQEVLDAAHPATPGEIIDVETEEVPEPEEIEAEEEDASPHSDGTSASEAAEGAAHRPPQRDPGRGLCETGRPD